MAAIKSDKNRIAIGFQSRRQAIHGISCKGRLVVRQHLIAGNDHLLNFRRQNIKARIDHLHVERTHELLDELTGLFLFDFLPQIALDFSALLLQLGLTGKYLLPALIDADEVIAPFAAYGFRYLIHWQGESNLRKIRIHFVIGQKT